jgi:hypothetical protein
MSRATSSVGGISARSFAFDELDVVLDSPIPRYPPGRPRVTIVSPDGHVDDRENVSPSPCKRSEARTPVSILKTPGRASRSAGVLAVSAAAQQPSSTTKFKVTNTAQPAAGYQSQRPAPIQAPTATPARSRRAASEASDYAVTPYVSRYLQDIEAREAALREEAEKAAAAASQPAGPKGKSATAAARRTLARRDEEEHEDDDSGRQTANPAMQGLRNALRTAMGVNFETPAAFKGRGGEAPRAPRHTLELADETLRQLDLDDGEEEDGPVAGKGKREQKKATAAPAAKKAPPAPAAAAKRNGGSKARPPHREPTPDSDDDVDDADFDDVDAESDVSNDVAPPPPPPPARNKSKSKQPAAKKATAAPVFAHDDDDSDDAAVARNEPPKRVRRLTATRSLPQAVDAALLREATRAASANRGAKSNAARSQSKRNKSKSMEPVILRRRSGNGPAIDISRNHALDDTPEDHDVHEGLSDDDDDGGASPFAGIHRHQEKRAPAAAAAPAVKSAKAPPKRANAAPPAAPPARAPRAPAAGKKAAETAAQKKRREATEAAEAAASRARQPQQRQQQAARGAKGQRSAGVSFAASHTAFSPVDTYSDDAASVATDDLLDANQDLRDRYSADPLDRLDRLAAAATAGWPFAAGGTDAFATYRPAATRSTTASAPRQQQQRRPATAAAPQAPSMARSAPRSAAAAPSLPMADNPMAAFFMQAFPNSVNLPPNLSGFAAAGHGGRGGMRLPIAIGKKHRV